MNNLLGITLVFENCETIEIAAKDLGFVKVDGVTDCLLWSNQAPEGIRFKNAGYVEILIRASGNKHYAPFDDADEDDNKVFDRITQFKDITCVDLDFDDREESYNVQWEDYQNEFTNKLQRTSYLGDKLLLQIGENKY